MNRVVRVHAPAGRCGSGRARACPPNERRNRGSGALSRLPPSLAPVSLRSTPQCLEKGPMRGVGGLPEGRHTVPGAMLMSFALTTTRRERHKQHTCAHAHAERLVGRQPIRRARRLGSRATRRLRVLGGKKAAAGRSLLNAREAEEAAKRPEAEGRGNFCVVL